ncbi:hypothetical protein WDU94_008650 [Cyamophila willieti]
MDYIHCHQCYRRFGPDIKFYITSCGHTFCTKCSPSNLIPRCFTCSRSNVQAVPIDKQMPESVAVYFSQNLAEEQNLLTKKYEFQLFQFKHLYKHLVNSEQAYEVVCKQIDKNLNEFKKCTSYLKLPKCSLLTNKNPAQNRTPSKVPPNIKQLPYLPSPVGNSFSDTAGGRSNKNMSGPNQVAKNEMNVPRMMPNKARRDGQNSQSEMNMSQSRRNIQTSQSQLAMSHMSQSQTPYRDMRGSMCSLNSSICSTSSVPSPSQHRSRPIAHPQLQRAQHNSNSQLLHGHHRVPRQMSNSQDIAHARIPRNPRSTFTPQGYSQGRHLPDGSHRPHPGRLLQRTDSMSSSLSKMSTTPSMSSGQSRMSTTPGLNNSIRSESSRSRCPSDRGMRVSTPQDCAQPQKFRTPQEMEQGTSKYPLAQKTNLLQMQRQGSQHRDSTRNGGMKRIERGTNERMDRNNNVVKLQSGMIDRRPSGSRSSQEERERCNQFTQSPFTKYRKPQSSPALLNTPVSQSGMKRVPSNPNVLNTPMSASSGTPTPPNGYRLVSPRTSSSLSSSNSRSRQEAPYNRSSGGSRPTDHKIKEGINRLMGGSCPVEMKTPSLCPVYKQTNPAPPFQDTLKMLTAAVKKSKI